ncbi:MAG: 2Fe-2S iron-sulfur cluster binding domain-containing protein [Bacteroidetes bacterium]|nr:2Fe-2S iron-sulfur cluster binding domain-containing protein [Bacteroidota bacterium]
MSVKEFHKLRVKNIKRQTTDCVSVCFDIPNDLKSTFQFKAGQHIIIRKEINGKELRRTYSICTSPNENEFCIAVKKIENGAFSSFANSVLKKGDELELMPPHGRFHVETNSKNSKNYLAFSAGSGITPIISIIKSVLHDEPDSSFTLFYGNRKTETTIFLEELEALKNLNISRLSIYYIMSRETIGSSLFKGHLDSEKCLKFSKTFFDPAQIDEVFICGPIKMTETVKKCLLSLGIDSSKIHHELFTNIGLKTNIEATKITDNIKSNITIINDGAELNFNLETSDENILDAALKNGANLPFACKGGVCCTCRAKLLEGEVKMDVNYSLEPDEINNGFILTCQSHPVSKKIKISFDEV